MQITPILFEAYLKCTTKCYLRSLGESGAGDSFSEWMKAQNESYRKNRVEQLTLDIAPEEYAFGPSAAECLRHTKWKFAVDVVADAKNMNSTIHAVERLPSIGQGHPAQFIPKRFISTNKLTRNDKLLMAFDALVLSETIGRGVKFGKIVHGDNHATLKVDAYALAKETRKLVEKIATVISVSSPPELILNPHCTECEFQSQCRQHAVEKDDLSLLSSMTEKERRKFNSKGIFTVTQLSYTFRPRRRPKRLREKREKYHHALKALAIRQKKIHIVGQPHLKIEGTLVYLDVEGLPDRDFYYLIGVRIKTHQSVVERSFWASDAEGEREIWISFLKILAEIENPVLIHYGSFETTFFRRMLERYGEPLDGSGAASTIKSALNLISLLFAQVYFPTYSNRLKDLAGSLSFRWSSANPSGIQSIIWRTKWEQTGDSSAKQSLITYNLEDCQALEVLTQTLLHFLNPDAQH
jgi:predicted RecB family nuclease